MSLCSRCFRMGRRNARSLSSGRPKAGPGGLLRPTVCPLLRLRPGLAADALRLLATLLDLAEGAPEADIADPDDGARITDGVGLQGHRGRVVRAPSAYNPRRHHARAAQFP